MVAYGSWQKGGLSMKTLLPVILEELSAGRAVALATVLLAKGSAPRGAGACQLLLQNGRDLGTVGGGVLERRALDELQGILRQAGTSVRPEPPYGMPDAAGYIVLPEGVASQVQEYSLTQNQVQSLGMVCGGNVSLLYQAVTPPMLPFWQALQARVAAGRSVWFARALTDGRVTAMAVYGEDTPAPADGQASPPRGGRLAAWLAPDGTPHTGGAAGQSWVVEPVALASRTYLFGGGHVSQCLAPLLAQLDFAPVVYDDRPAFADRALFPTAADVVCAPFSEAGARLAVTADDAIVIMTRGHANDLETLIHALRTPAYYIGLIGSRSKIAHTKELLNQRGFSDADFARVHAPVGLPILAETPMEISVSVAAEMILCRANHDGRTR